MTNVLPSWQLNVLWVVVCTQIQHSINELDPLHSQDLEICLSGNQIYKISFAHASQILLNQLTKTKHE